MNRTTRVLLLGSVFALAAIPAVRADGLLDNAKAAGQGAWKQTREAAQAAGDWTGEKAHHGWSAAKEGATDAAVWAGDKTRSGWEATKEEADSVWDKVKPDRQ